MRKELEIIWKNIKNKNSKMVVKLLLMKMIRILMVIQHHWMYSVKKSRKQC